MPDRTSCCMDTVSSQFVGQGDAGSNPVAPFGTPKLELRDAPISLNCGLPAAASAEPLPSRSVQPRVAVWSCIGLVDEAVPADADATYLPTVAFSAVLP